MFQHHVHRSLRDSVQRTVQACSGEKRDVYCLYLVILIEILVRVRRTHTHHAPPWTHKLLSPQTFTRRTGHAPNLQNTDPYTSRPNPSPDGGSSSTHTTVALSLPLSN